MYTHIYPWYLYISVVYNNHRAPCASFAKLLENVRVAEEAFTQKEIKGETRLAGALQKEAVSWPGGKVWTVQNS